MGQFSVEKLVLPGSALSGNQHTCPKIELLPEYPGICLQNFVKLATLFHTVLGLVVEENDSKTLKEFQAVRDHGRGADDCRQVGLIEKNSKLLLLALRQAKNLTKVNFDAL